MINSPQVNEISPTRMRKDRAASVLSRWVLNQSLAGSLPGWVLI